ncbi:hypothetical protein F4861DRAFT_536519 [Xylaria intraflava]|nr:hypothetical protein F4861DRAFT_536519 [Xylaria intraflava]
MNRTILNSVCRAAMLHPQGATPRLRLRLTNTPSLLPHGRTIGATYSSVSKRPDEEGSVIVTGSAKGIGKAIALRLAADGYDVCVNDVASNQAICDEIVKEIRSMGRKSCTAIADVTKRDEVVGMIQTSVRELGPLRTMIANAGTSNAVELIDMPDQEFQRLFAVNVFGVQNCFSEAAKQLISQGTCRPDRPGKLIAASSIAGFKAFATLGHYTSSKWAVRGLMQAYAVEMAEHNITANAYAPGIVDTTIWDNMKPGMANKLGLKTDEVMNALVHSLTMLKRMSVPEDVAKLVSFLASSDSDFVTGQTQLVDGGVIPT